MTAVAAVPSFSSGKSGHVLYDMVLTRPDTFRAEDAVQSMIRIALIVHPMLYTSKHVPVELKVVVTDGRVVEDPTDIFQDFVLGHVRVVPGVYYTRSDVLKNHRGQLSSRLVQNVAEVILRKHRVSRVCAVRVVPNEVLLLSTSINDSAAACL